ncbi:MAG: hypothetical protein NTY86_02515, partial [Deltaproteobacteria bacterium]|nr:hypothetical protein [Deltaproteobacteria bacterium]
MSVERKFYWTCGKGHGAGLYRDDDLLAGDFSIVCPICGNRYYGDVGGRARGLAPVKTYYTPESAPLPFGASHFILERTANIMTGSGQIRPRTTEKKEESMAVTKACANCGRVLSIFGGGCCYVCYHAAKGLEGTAKDDARAAIKAKIESGGLRRGGRSGPRPKGRIAPPDPAIAPTRRKSLRQMAVDAMHEATRGDKEGGMVPGGAKDIRYFTGGPLLPGEKIVHARVAEGVPVISIDFADERDRKIYDALIAEAARMRRTPEQ